MKCSNACKVSFILSLCFFLFCNNSEIISADNVCVDLTKGCPDTYMIRNILECTCIGTIIRDGVTTIGEGGIYTLIGNTDGCIVVDADDVLINLNGATLYGNCDPVIRVAPGHKNIKISNGTIKGQGGCTSNRGISIECENSDVEIDGVNIYDCSIGIELAGSDGCFVRAVRVSNTQIHDCCRGVVVEYGIKNVFDTCEVYNSVFRAFQLLKSSYNVFEKCKALETVNGELDEHVVAFESSKGRANLFKDCVVEGTTKTASGFYDNAIGFLLTGDETEMESETKILNSVVNTTVVEDGLGVAYGIMFEPALLSADLTSDLLDQFVHGTRVFATEWSPNCNYIVVAGEKLPGSDINLRVLHFEDKKIADIPGTEVAYGAIIHSVSWEPTGNHVVVGGDDPADNYELRVYSFNGYTFETFDDLAYDFGATIFAVSWSPTGKFIAMGGGTGNYGAQVQVVSFVYDEYLGTLQGAFFDHAAAVYSLDFSPNEKYIAIGGENGTGNYDLRVLRFDGALLTEIAGANYDHGATVRFVRWSPTGEYLAIGGDVGTGGDSVRVFKFDGNSLQVLPGAVYGNGAPIRSLAWSPNGRYLAIVGNNDAENYEVRILQFNGTTLTPVPGLVYNHDGVIYTVSWTNNGYYLATGGPKIATGADFDVFKVMNYPSRCVVDGNHACNAQRNGFGAIGISGSSANNILIRNICYENDVNVSEGVFNTSFGGLIEFPSPIFNLAVPPY